MKVFVSSLIGGMEQLRAAAREAITTLRHEPVMAEDFGAQPNSPQVACLTELRQSDVVVLIMGAGYGALQPSGLSATHEEYEAAKGNKYIFAFVQEGIEREQRESDFISEVQKWESGLFRGGFRTDGELRNGIIRALHDHALAKATGPVDQGEMAKRAAALLPTERRNSMGTATLNLAIAGGPRQAVLRPIEIERPELAKALMQRALFGERPLMNVAFGAKPSMEGEALIIRQERGVKILLNEEGSVVISMPVENKNRMMPELIYEVVMQQFTDALGYGSWVLEHIDPTQRPTHVAIAASITGAAYMAWRTQQESNASPNSMSVGMGNSDNALAQSSQTRAALRLNAATIIEDLVVPLRRQWR